MYLNRDIEIRNFAAERLDEGYALESVMESIYAKGRDNARTPMQWTAGENAGFTTGKPWLPVNPNHRVINAEAAVADPDSVFHHYRKLIELRKEYDVLRDGSFTLLDSRDEKVFAYTRDTRMGHLLVVCNFTAGEAAFAMPEAFEKARCLIGNYPALGDRLKPYQAAMFYYED